MSGPIKDDDEDKPLDPAVEQVRRRLVRFIGINLGLLFLALMAVVVAIVYRAGRAPEPPAAEVTELPTPAEGMVIEDAIMLPSGARALGHSLAGSRLSVLAQLADGRQQVVVYDIAARRVIARIALTAGQ